MLHGLQTAGPGNFQSIIHIPNVNVIFSKKKNVHDKYR